MNRKDGRTPNQLRPIELSQSILSRSDGSGKFNFGSTTVLTSCRGPVEIRIAKEEIDKATLEIDVKPLTSLPGPAEKSLQQFLHHLFTPIIQLSTYPRSLIQLSLQTISHPSLTFSQEISSTSTSLPTIPSSTSVVLKATSINSTYLALLDAGIALNSIVTAVGISILNSIPILDPTPLEESQSTSSHLFVYSFKGTEQGECIGIESSGKFSVEEFEQCRELGESGSEAVRNVLRKAVEGKYGVNEMKQERMEE